MKTDTTNNNNRKRVIAILAILLLVAAGVGDMYYMHNRNTQNNNNNAAAMAANSTAPDAAVTALPVTTPADNAPQLSPESKPLASASLRRRHHSKNVTPAGEDQVNVSSPNSYEGNMPAATTPEMVSVPDQPKTTLVTTQQAKTTAYSRKYGRVNIAPEFGGNLNGLYHNNTANLLTNSFHAGIMINIGLSNDFALQPGLRYIQKGNEDKSTIASPEVAEVNNTRIMQLQYMELPLNLVYKFGDKAGAPRFMVGAGPYVSYLLNAKDKMSSTAISYEDDGLNSQNNTVNTTGSMKRLDYGIGGFVGCQMPKGFYANAGTEWGFRDIDQDPATGKAADRNYTFLLSVGYILGPKGKEY